MFWWCGLLLWIISILQSSHFDRKGGFFPLSTPSSSYLCAFVFFPTCVQCSSKCCCFHQKALFFLSTSSSYLYVCFLYLCAVLFQVLLLPPEGTFFSFPPHRLLTCMCFPPHLCAVLFRVLLRREQVLKVACNHLISTTMELKPMATSETAWCWVATDYTDNQPHVEQFAVKFKVSQEVFFVCFLKSH